MEEVLDLYAQAPQKGVVYLAVDEKGKELQSEIRQALPLEAGKPRRYDYSYQREGSCNLFVAYNWQSGQRHVQVTQRRRGEDWAEFLHFLAIECYPDAEKIVIVCDNLNIHDTASLYECYPAALARQIASRLEFHYTPVHASWLNMAEIELSVLERQCLARRFAELAQVEREVKAWEAERNRLGAKICWQFTKEKAREKLKSAYPQPLFSTEPVFSQLALPFAV